MRSWNSFFASVVAAVLFVALVFQEPTNAALNAVAPRAPKLELLVFEHPDCTYCQVFRRDVLPKYRQAVPGDAVPLRFIDVNTAEMRRLSLQGRIDTVPTAVLMKDANEIGRISGYWGPSNFFKMLAHMLARLE